VIKAIREFTHEWILAVHNAKCMAQKPSKVFISIYLPKTPIIAKDARLKVESDYP
jgi:hypothetical protein